MIIGIKLNKTYVQYTETLLDAIDEFVLQYAPTVGGAIERRDFWGERSSTSTDN